MPIEQRVVSTPRPTVPQPSKITPRDRSKAPEPPPEPEKKKGKGLVIALIVLATIVVAGAVVFWFFIRPGLNAEAGEQVEPEPVAGAVQTVESMNINLADGHYLRLGFAVQLTTEAEEVEPAMILDRTIAQYSGRKMSEVLDPAAREELKEQLKDQLNVLYEGEVMDVWLTDYVAQ